MYQFYYRILRPQILENVEKCQLCGKVTEKLYLTRIYNHRQFPQLYYAKNNLIPLCQKCNSMMNAMEYKFPMSKAYFFTRFLQ